MSASRSGTRRTCRSIPTSPLDAISADDEVRPAAPRSCSATSSPRSSSSSEHSSSFFSSNGSPICTDGRLSSDSSSSALASTDAPPIPSRPVRAPNSTTTLPTPAAARPDQPVGLDQPDAHRVDQAVLLVRALEVDLAADGRDPDRVAVVADPRHRALEQVARAGRVRDLAEAQRVEHRDRPRADREDVAQDAADAGRGALERLDRARVVVRLDLERARQPVADRHRARVLARAHHEPRALGRQRLEQPPRVLVAAVLGPHQREDGELDLVRLAAQLVDDQLVLGVGEPELAMLAHAGTRAADRNSCSPSAEPVSGSTACSGCGIRPDDVAGRVADPRDVPRGAVEVLAGGVAQHDLAVGLELVEHRIGRPEAARRVLGRDREPVAGASTRRSTRSTR